MKYFKHRDFHVLGWDVSRMLKKKKKKKAKQNNKTPNTTLKNEPQRPFPQKKYKLS